MIVRINKNVADLRREPSTKAERVSQGLYNELVEVIEDGPEMRKVRFTDNYEGYMARQFLSPYEGYKGDGPFFINDVFVSAYEKPDASSSRVAFLPYGCLLYGSTSGGFLKTSSDRYGDIFIPKSMLIDKIKLISPKDTESDDLAREAGKFLSVPYLWGGRSCFGIDCSGFVKAVIGRFGVELPRDTKDQINFGREVKREEIKKGDLVFFPRHVAIYLGQDLYIHSSSKNGGVSYNSFNPKSTIYNVDLDKSFITARRVFI